MILLLVMGAGDHDCVVVQGSAGMTGRKGATSSSKRKARGRRKALLDALDQVCWAIQPHHRFPHLPTYRACMALLSITISTALSAAQS